MASGQHPKKFGFLFVLFFLFSHPDAGLASSDQAIHCESAANLAASEFRVPADILRSLTATETGRSMQGAIRPWPWAINHAGEGHWFHTKAELLAHAQGLIDAGETNFDIGCFQLNVRWHGQNFSSLDDMADPTQNARYAASFLLSKWHKTQNWSEAVGAYHSNTPIHAETYLNRFWTVYAQLGPPEYPRQLPVPETIVPVQSRPNQFPLLISGQQSSGPSLVPTTQARRPILGAD
jgi:hypothetical protein